MIATWLWDRKVGLMTFLDFLWWKPISEWVNDFRYLCGLDLGGEVPYEHRTWTEGACAHLSVSEESSPRSHTLSHSLSAVRLSSSLYHICRLSWSQLYSSFQLIHLDTSFASLLFIIITHFPSWKVSPVNLLSTSAFQSQTIFQSQKTVASETILLYSVPVLYGRAVCNQQPPAQFHQGMITVAHV